MCDAATILSVAAGDCGLPLCAADLPHGHLPGSKGEGRFSKALVANSLSAASKSMTTHTNTTSAADKHRAHIHTLPLVSAVTNCLPPGCHSSWLMGCRCVLLSSSRWHLAASHSDTAPSCHAIARTCLLGCHARATAGVQRTFLMPPLACGHAVPCMHAGGVVSCVRPVCVCYITPRALCVCAGQLLTWAVRMATLLAPVVATASSGCVCWPCACRRSSCWLGEQHVLCVLDISGMNCPTTFDHAHSALLGSVRVVNVSMLGCRVFWREPAATG